MVHSVSEIISGIFHLLLGGGVPQGAAVDQRVGWPVIWILEACVTVNLER